MLPFCFPQLEVLELSYNRIQSIAALHLKGLHCLRVLTLEGNEISKIDGLAGLPALQQLVLAKNKIKRFEAGNRSFAGLNELRGLQLEENGLRSLAGLGALPKLRALFLAFNRLSELGELEHLAPERCSPVLSEVTLRNNPLSRKHLYRAALIRRLSTIGPAGEQQPPSWLCTIDGKEVSAEERERADAIFAGGRGAIGGSVGPNGEPLVASGGGMPNGAVYYYASSPEAPRSYQGAGGAVQQPMLMVDKVPLQTKSFSMGGLLDSVSGSGGFAGSGAGGGGGGMSFANAQQQAHAQHMQAQAQMTHHSGGGGVGALSLGIGGVSIGHAHSSSHSAAALQHQMANMSLNLHTNGMANMAHTGVGSHPRRSFTAAATAQQQQQHQQQQSMFTHQYGSSPPALSASSLHLQVGSLNAHAAKLLAPSAAAAHLKMREHTKLQQRK